MRIAFLSVSDQMGGSEGMLLQLFARLRQARPSWELHAVLPGGGPLASRAAALGVSTTTVPMPEPLRRLGEWGAARHGLPRMLAQMARGAACVPRYERAMRGELARIDPDVIHSNGFKTHLVSARLRPRRAALVWHLHEYVGARPLTRRLLRRYAGRCDAIVANSQSVADDARRAIGPLPGLRVIHNAVDLARFSPEGPAADLDALAAMPPGGPALIRVGLVATFSRWKGHETFLRAMAALPASAPVRGYVIGGALYDTDGSQYSRAELESMADALGVRGRVGFTGFVEAPEMVMRGLDVVIHASTDSEAFGLVIAEAMACARAVITSGIGGAAELVRDGDDALTHKAGDADDLARCIAALAADGRLRARLGQSALQAARRRFDARRLGEQFAASYEEAAQVRH